MKLLKEKLSIQTEMKNKTKNRLEMLTTMRMNLTSFIELRINKIISDQEQPHYFN